jgi:branched-chain amino acid aminotransferase
MTTFALQKNPQPQTPSVRDVILGAPVFGTQFTDHMSHIRYTTEQGWHGHEVVPYGPLSIDPAAAVLHYAQEIFEGMKVYRHADGSVWTFRPDRNAERMNKSAERMALPQMDEGDFLDSLRALVEQDKDWVPTPRDDQDEVSLYLRPFMISVERFLGLRPTQQADYYVIASPAAAYFAGGVKPVRIWLSENVKRAGKGGTGFAKYGGNYAASTAAMIEAGQKGCDQVLFTDAIDGTHLLTPPVSETILDGVTRRSILDLAPQLGLTPEERPITVDEWRTGAADGTIVEAFACGTAAAVTPIGSLAAEGWSFTQSEQPGEVTMNVRRTLLDIQYGRAEAPAGWMVQLA